MGEIFKALGLISLGMAISEVYNTRAWNRYLKGRRDEKEDEHTVRGRYHR